MVSGRDLVVIVFAVCSFAAFVMGYIWLGIIDLMVAVCWLVVGD